MADRTMGDQRSCRGMEDVMNFSEMKVILPVIISFGVMCGTLSDFNSLFEKAEVWTVYQGGRT